MITKEQLDRIEAKLDALLSAYSTVSTASNAEMDDIEEMKTVGEMGIDIIAYLKYRQRHGRDAAIKKYLTH